MKIFENGFATVMEMLLQIILKANGLMAMVLHI